MNDYTSVEWRKFIHFISSQCKNPYPRELFSSFYEKSFSYKQGKEKKGHVSSLMLSSALLCRTSLVAPVRIVTLTSPYFSAILYIHYTHHIECIDLKWILQLFLNLRNDDGSITFEHSRLDSIIIISTHHRRLELSIEWNNERKLSEIFHLRTHSSPLFQHCIAHHIFLMCHSDDLSLSPSESLSTLRFCKPHKLVIFSVVYKSATKSSKYEFCVK